MCMCGYICFSTYKPSAERSKIQKQNTGHEYFELGKRPNFFGDSQSTTIIMCQVTFNVWPRQPFSICPGWIYLSQLIDLEQRDPNPEETPHKSTPIPLLSCSTKSHLLSGQVDHFLFVLAGYCRIL